MLTKKLFNKCNKLIKFNMNYYASDVKCSKKTPLYNLHVESGGKLVDFAGFSLPVQYSDLSLTASHIHTRNSASIFDVSHMLQTYIIGRDSIEYFETMCPVDLKNCQDGVANLTVFLNKNGGIIDDLIVTKVSDNMLYVVSNAGCTQKDQKHMSEHCSKFKRDGKQVDIKFLTVNDQGLIALQGPRACLNLQQLVDYDLSKLYFMNSSEMNVAGVECRVTRCGYTGEDGFEISTKAKYLETITKKLIESNEVKLAGLGARDSLRLEAGMCLYGNDIDETITPVEANLTWLIAKSRRQDAKFPGADVILKQIANGVQRRRCGLKLAAGAPARKDAIIKSVDGREVGRVTSGCPSPSLGVNIAMGYVSEDLKSVGTELLVNTRGKDVACRVEKMPFVPTKYYIDK